MTDNRNAYAASQEENKKLSTLSEQFKGKMESYKAATSKAEQTISELRSKCEDAEKKNTILGIKLETAIEEHSVLNEQNAILNNKMDELKNNIGNAECRSEQVAHVKPVS